jgi:hypothetical protein
MRKDGANDLWDEDGRWVGPRSLRVFLDENRGFAVFWLLVLSLIASGFWADIGGVSSFAVAIPLGIVTGAAVSLAAMYAFSRGWIVDDD